MKDSLADAATRSILKRERFESVANLVVETATGNLFQGDEVSQGRMARVLLAHAEDMPDGEIDWILADNTVATITLLELDEALRLSVDAQTDLWTRGHHHGD
jgi:hypothetical protein